MFVFFYVFLGALVQIELKASICPHKLINNYLNGVGGMELVH